MIPNTPPLDVSFPPSPARPNFRGRAVRSRWRVVSTPVLGCSLLAVLLLGAPRALAKPHAVAIEGIVDTESVEDVLNEPYAKSINNFVSPGELSTHFSFDIPDGKRLIIESIVVSVRVQPGQRALVNLRAPSGQAAANLGLQPQGVIDGSEYFMGTHPVRLRLDAIPGADSEFTFIMTRSDNTGNGDFLVAVYGYLVPLPW